MRDASAAHSRESGNPIAGSPQRGILCARAQWGPRAGTSEEHAQSRRHLLGRRSRRRAVLAGAATARRRRSASGKRLRLREARRAAAALRYCIDARAPGSPDRAICARSRDRARRQFSRRRRSRAHDRSRSRRAQCATARTRLGLAPRQSRSRSGRWHRRPVRRFAGDRTAHLPPRAVAASKRRRDRRPSASARARGAARTRGEPALLCRRRPPSHHARVRRLCGRAQRARPRHRDAVSFACLHRAHAGRTRGSTRSPRRSACRIDRGLRRGELASAASTADFAARRIRHFARGVLRQLPSRRRLHPDRILGLRLGRPILPPQAGRQRAIAGRAVAATSSRFFAASPSPWLAAIANHL